MLPVIYFNYMVSIKYYGFYKNEMKMPRYFDISEENGTVSTNCVPKLYRSRYITEMSINFAFLT